jgi:hypothetical protein
MKPTLSFLGIIFTAMRAGLFTVLLGLLLSTAKADLGDGLIAYWPMDGNFSDIAGGHHGTGAGVIPITFEQQPVTGRGRVARLDGVSQFIEITGGSEDDFDFTSASMSVSVWFTMESNVSGQTLISKGDSSWAIRRSGNRLDRMLVELGSSAFREGWAINRPIHHLVTTFDSGRTTVRLYIDGRLMTESRRADGLEYLATKLTIGTDPVDSSLRWAGIIDDVAIWNRVLDDGEVGEIWGDGAGQPLLTLLPDSDGDAMADLWEAHFKLPVQQTDAGEDADADGLTNIKEYRLGSDPADPDTDDDGFLDGVETGTGTWQSVSDTGTDLFNSDSDGDGLFDGVEVPDESAIATIQAATDPNKPDSDGDGASDYREFIFFDSKPRALDVPFTADRRFRVSVATEPDSYYILYRDISPDGLQEFSSPVSLIQGTDETLVLQDPYVPPTRSRAFYRVARVSSRMPLDSDRDGIDDVTELNMVGALSALIPSVPIPREYGLLALPDFSAFEELASTHAEAGIPGPPSVKALLTRNRGRPELYFLNTKK